MNFNHVACFGHTLNTGVTRAFNIQPVKMCITNATRIRSIFHFSNKMKRSLLEAQNQLKLPTLVAPSSSETRWWSVLPCLYFVKTQYSALLQIFTIPKHYNLLPTRNQMKLINRLLKVIEPLKLLGESMASEKNITISDLWPIYQKLNLMYKPLNQRNDVDYNNLSDNEYSVPLFQNTDDNDYTEIFTQPSNQDDSGGEDDEEETSETNSLSQALKHVEQLVVSEIFETLSKRYSSDEKTMKLLKKASFLDPRHRNKYLGNQNQIGVIHDEIKLEMEQISNNISANDHSLKKTHHYTGIAAFLDNPTSSSVENEVSTTESEAESINREILGYLQMPLVNLSTNSTDWWGKFGAEFPKLETLAKKYLCIPGVPFERLFSTGGNICTDNRASLAPGHAEQLIFLSKNSQFF